MALALLALAAAVAAADIPESELVTKVGDKEIFAPAFRGNWAATTKDCFLDSESGIEITLDHIYGYEWDAVLLKSTPMIYQPHGRDDWAYTVVVLLAGRSETNLDVSKLRISRVGTKLYMSNAERVAEDTHLTPTFANVRCPAALPKRPEGR